MDNNFSVLPLTIQLDIFRRLDKKNLQNGRFVCKYWLACINYSRKPTVLLSDQSCDLKFYNTSSYESLGTLNVACCKNPLPIYSSKRNELPQAANLVLESGISSENILKLLRYYSVSCKSLCLSSFCFGNIPSYQMTGRIESSKLTHLAIKFQPNWYNNSNNDPDITSIRPEDFQLHSHMNALSKFLRAIHLPSLTSLSIVTPVSDEQQQLYYGISNWTPRPPPVMFSPKFCIKMFNDSLEIFVQNYGAQINSFYMDTPSLQAINLFEHLPNVQNLSLVMYNYSPQFKPEKDLSNFKKLEILSIQVHTIKHGDCINAEDRIASLLVANNKHSLKSFKLGHHLWYTVESSRLSWLYANPGLVIAKLHINSMMNFRYNLDQAYLLNFKLYHVREFHFEVWSYYNPNSRDQDIYKWIIHVMPNLKNLDISIYPSPTLAAIKSIIEELKMLARIRFFSRASSFEITKWGCRYPNTDIRGISISDGSFEIKIRRPMEGPVLIN